MQYTRMHSMTAVQVKTHTPLYPTLPPHVCTCPVKLTAKLITKETQYTLSL